MVLEATNRVVRENVVFKRYRLSLVYMSIFSSIYGRVANTIRPHVTRVVAVTVLGLIATGTVVPARPATALAHPAAVVTIDAKDPPSGSWVMTNDLASGISVMLPGEATVKNTTTPDADGVNVPVRQYILQLNGGNGAVIFEVGDAAHRSFDPDKGLQGISSAYPDGKVTASRHLIVNGAPAIDGRITATIAGTPAVCLARFIDDRGYVVGILTLGRITDESELTSLHQQVIKTLHLI